MKIKPNATPGELSSPFFKKNEEFCVDFERFINSKKGLVKGQYNAWSYAIFGKISDPEKWTLKYKKATFSSGNLLLSSKHQNLFVMVEWITKRIGTSSSEFVIRRKSKMDFIKILLNPSLTKLEVNNKYILQSKETESYLISKLTTILEPLIKSGELYSINHKGDELKIELRSVKHHFDIFNKLIKL